MLRGNLRRPLGVAALSFAAAAPALAQTNPACDIAPSGQELCVEIVCHDVLDEGDTSFLVDVCATLGQPTQNVNVLFVIDLSGSMEDDAGAGGDANGDGLPNSYLDAAIVGLISLLDTMPANPNIDIGVIGFATSAIAGDVSPVAGDQTWTSPPSADLDNDNVKDIEQVLRSLRIRSNNFNTFTTKGALGIFTNYTAALDQCANALSQQPPGEKNVIFWISDGEPNVGNPFDPSLFSLSALHDPIINAYGIGVEGAAACAPNGDLDTLASNTGGNCTPVLAPANLVTVLPDAATTEVTGLIVKVNGVPVANSGRISTQQFCLNSLDLFPFIDQFGPNLIEACATTGDGLQVVAAKDPVMTACLLYVGTQPDQTLYAPNATDTWYVKPRFDWTVTEAQVPTFTVPTQPAAMGKKFYYQVFMHNQAVFPNNAVQMSNGIEVTIGGPVVSYGHATGIWAWFQGSTAPGQQYQILFDVLAM
ncbi:MAG: VWA domain-containing protein [Planctomycetota bacterium]